MKEQFGLGQTEEYALRCYDCGYEFKKFLTVNDSICELSCSGCGKQTCEINFGKKSRGNLI